MQIFSSYIIEVLVIKFTMKLIIHVKEMSKHLL